MKTPIPIAFGLALKQLRIEKRYSQVTLSRKSGYDRTFISLLERGIRQPSLTTMVDLCVALKIPLKDLIARFESQAGKKE